MSELKSLELQFCWQLTDAGVLLVQLCLCLHAFLQHSIVSVRQVLVLLDSRLDQQLTMTMC